jgi:hypothetical protein
MRRFAPLSGNIISSEDPMPTRVRLFFSILTVVFFFLLGTLIEAGQLRLTDDSSGRPSRSQG